MKLYFRIIMIFIMTLYSIALTGQCVNGISTNPKAPKNNQIPTIFGNDKKNIFLNQFDWTKVSGTTYDQIPINLKAGFNLGVGPITTNDSTWEMISPYSIGMPSSYSYLYSPIGSFDQDNKWEDGWELLWMNTGYYPNGDEINTPNYFHPNGTSTTVGEVSYIVLYNRYTGILRVFAKLFATVGQFDMIRIKLKFDNPSLQDVSGLLRYLEPFDRPLDQVTRVLSHSTIMEQSQSNNHWVSADFNVAYDPCTCFYASLLKISFSAIKEMDITLKGRSIAVEQDLIKHIDSLENYLSIEDVDNSQAGQVMYSTLSSMADEYLEDVKKYEEDLGKYNSYKSNIYYKALEFGKDHIINGLSGALPTKEVSEYILKEHAVITSDKKLKSKLDKGVKSLMTDNWDKFTGALFGEAPKKPVAPHRPVVNMSEYTFTGNVDDTIHINSNGFYTPGTYPHAFPNYNVIDPLAYPAYNEVLGLFSMLESPKFYYYYRDSKEFNYNNASTKAEGAYHQKLRMKLAEPLKWYLNPALDWDYNKTKVYAKLIVEFEKDTIEEYPNQYSKYDRTYDGFGAFKTKYAEHVIDTAFFKYGEQRSFEETRDFSLYTQYYALEDFGKEQFAIDVSTTTLEYVNAYHGKQYEDGWLAHDDQKIPVKRIKLRLMVDMYFNQIGSTGGQVNTTHVVTYDLFAEPEKHLVDVKFEKNALSFFNDTLQLSGTITSTHPSIWEINDKELVVKARGIEVIDDLTVQNGYELKLIAKNSIDVSQNVELGENITMSLDGLTAIDNSPMMSWKGVEAICNEGLYKGNTIADKRIIEASVKESLIPKESQLEWKVFPNPNDGDFSISIYADNSNKAEVTLYNLTGQVIRNQSIEVQTGMNQLNFTQLAKGMYIMNITINGLSNSKKVVVN